MGDTAMAIVTWKRLRSAIQVLMVIFVVTTSGFSQEKNTNDRAAGNERSIRIGVSPDLFNSDISANTLSPINFDIKSDGRSFLLDILKDQKAIFTSPAHLRKKDLRYLVPIGIAMAGLLATDHQTTVEINEHPSGR